jgi:hypothetical protein
MYRLPNTGYQLIYPENFPFRVCSQ